MANKVQNLYARTQQQINLISKNTKDLSLFAKTKRNFNLYLLYFKLSFGFIMELSLGIVFQISQINRLYRIAPNINSRIVVSYIFSKLYGISTNFNHNVAITYAIRFLREFAMSIATTIGATFILRFLARFDASMGVNAPVVTATMTRINYVTLLTHDGFDLANRDALTLGDMDRTII